MTGIAIGCFLLTLLLGFAFGMVIGQERALCKTANESRRIIGSHRDVLGFIEHMGLEQKYGEYQLRRDSESRYCQERSLSQYYDPAI